MIHSVEIHKVHAQIMSKQALIKCFQEMEEIVKNNYGRAPKMKRLNLNLSGQAWTEAEDW